MDSIDPDEILCFFFLTMSILSGYMFIVSQQSWTMRVFEFSLFPCRRRWLFLFFKCQIHFNLENCFLLIYLIVTFLPIGVALQKSNAQGDICCKIDWQELIIYWEKDRLKIKHITIYQYFWYCFIGVYVCAIEESWLMIIHCSVLYWNIVLTLCVHSYTLPNKLTNELLP